jgi:hypothetical protein
VRELLRRVAPDYPEVAFRYAEAREAMNRVLFGSYEPPTTPLLSAEVSEGPRAGTRQLTVSATEPTFGPQPFLALRTCSGEYHHDNLDFQEPFRRWTYVLDDLTFPWEALDRVGVASNDRRGFAHVVLVRPREDGGEA